MKVAVITPYFKPQAEWLMKCHESVQAQTHPCTHFMIADGNPSEAVDSWDVQHVKLSHNHADYGDTPRGIGSVMAIAQGFDAIAYLDADNWYYPDHVASMVKVHRETGAAVISGTRDLHRLDGTLLGKTPQDDGINHVDTNCIVITRKAFDLVSVWWMMEWLYEIENEQLKKNLHTIGDRMLLAEIKFRKISHAHLSRPTVGYRTGFANHYLFFGEQPPAGAKSGSDVDGVVETFRKEAGMGRIKRRRKS